MTRNSGRVLVIGRSPGVLLDTVALLRACGHVADATNEFDYVLAHPDDFDVSGLDVVVFGGAVPPATKDQLRAVMSRCNAHLMFVEGLAGIPGLIAAQARGALGPGLRSGEVTYDEKERSVRVTLREADHVTLEAFWVTSLVPPEPKSASLVIVDAKLEAGLHETRLPEEIPCEASFVAVTVGPTVLTFSVGSTLTLAGPLPPVAPLNTRAG